MLMGEKSSPWRAPLLALIVLGLSMLACGGDATPEKVGEVAGPAATASEETTEAAAPEPTDTAVSEGPVVFQVGEIVEIRDTVMVVLGWETPEGDEFTKPAEGNRFVVVDVLLVNQGTDTDSVSSMLQMSLKDDTGQQYDLDLEATVAADADSPDGELAPGERIRGKVGFQVPQEAAGLVYVFDASLFGAGKVFVELGPEPVSVEVPAAVTGEQAQQAFAVGDVIEIGDLLLTVNEVTSPSGDEFNKPDEGTKFLVVDVTLENRGSESKTVSSMLQMWVKDATGQKYVLDLSASVASGGSTPDGEIVPGEKLRGQVGYQVPEDAEGMVFVFDADVFGQGKVFVALP